MKEAVNKYQIPTLDDVRLFYGCFLSTARRTVFRVVASLINISWKKDLGHTRLDSTIIIKR